MALWPSGFGIELFRSMHTDGGSIPYFFFGFPLVSKFVQVFEMLYVLISLSNF